MIAYFYNGNHATNDKNIAAINLKNMDGAYCDSSWRLHFIHATGKDIATNIVLSQDALDRLIRLMFTPEERRKNNITYIDINEGLADNSYLRRVYSET